MATGAQGAKAIAPLFGVSEVASLRVPKILRAGNAAFWPMAGKGGGKLAAHLEPMHLTCLLFGYAMASPATAAAKVAAAYRAISCPDETLPSVEGMSEIDQLLLGKMPRGNLGESSDFLIAYAGSGEDEAHLLSACNLSIELVGDEMEPRAVIRYLDMEAHSRPQEIHYGVPREYFLFPGKDKNWDFFSERNPAKPVHAVTFSAATIVEVGKLWADTLMHRKSDIAATEPRQGLDAAVRSYRPKRPDRPEQTDLARKNKKTQAAHTSKAGRSTSRNRANRHDEPRQAASDPR